MAGSEAPTPSPIPSPSNGPYSLSEQINIATRSVHTVLNRSILARLPLALPPHTTNPSIYVSGILHIAPIYITFETLWQSLIDTPHLPICDLEKTRIKPCRHRASSCVDGCAPGAPLIDSNSLPILPNLPHTEASTLLHCPDVCSRTHTILSHLLLPGLLRSGRLRADIRTLTGTPEHQIEESLDAVSENGRLVAFIAHTTKSVEKNPHVLLAYAWVMYMAIFSGGRYIRATLQAAVGPEGDFWTRESSPIRPYDITIMNEGRRPSSKSDTYDPFEIRQPRSSTRSEVRHKMRRSNSVSKNLPGFQFFNFSGDEDGEDIKREFKKRLTEAENLLTPGEREDIVTEAQRIFEFMIEMVNQLDDVCGTESDTLSKKVEDSRPLMSSRDSVQLTQERLTKKREYSRPPTKTKNSESHPSPQNQPPSHDSSDSPDNEKHEELRNDLEGLLGGGCPNPKLVRFNNDSPPTTRLFFLSRGVFWITKPLSRRFGSRGLNGRKSEFVASDMGLVLLTTVITSVLVVAVMAWWYEYKMVGCRSLGVGVDVGV